MSDGQYVAICLEIILAWGMICLNVHRAASRIIKAIEQSKK